MQHDNFFIGIGAQKGGSTWVHRQLYSHPHIWVPPLKELRFFDNYERLDRCRDWISERYARNRRRAKRAAANPEADADARWVIEFVDWLGGALKRIEGKSGLPFYEALFADQDPAAFRAFGEVTPTYSTLDAAGFARIREAAPQAKLLFIMRDPVDRCWSIAKKLALDQRQKPDLLHDPAYLRRYVEDPHHLRCSRYDWTIQALDATFAPEQAMLVYYEEVFASAESVAGFLRNLCAFIGLDYDATHFPRAAEVILPSERKPLSDQAVTTFQEVYWPVREYLEQRIGRVPDRWGAWQS